MAQSALAALHFIEAQPEEAVKLYEDVLKEKETRLDLLQRIHASHNLIEALSLTLAKDDAMDLEEAGSTDPRLEALRKSEETMQQKYLEERLVPISVNRAVLEETSNRLKDMGVDQWVQGSPWWFVLLNQLQDQGDQRLLLLVKRELSDRLSQPAQRVCFPFHLWLIA